MPRKPVKLPRKNKPGAGRPKVLGDSTSVAVRLPNRVVEAIRNRGETNSDAIRRSLQIAGYDNLSNPE